MGGPNGVRQTTGRETNMNAIPQAPRGTKANPFASVREAQRLGFGYFATDHETGMILVRASVYRGGLHFVLAYARADEAGTQA